MAQIVSIFDNEYVKRNSLKAWLLAARPKTLTGAAVPVMIGIAYAWHLMGTMSAAQIIPAVLCMAFAFVMQIDANFINDYYDCLKGRDTEERLGPLRACQQGWVSMRAMRIAIIITSILACIIGLPLIFYGGYELIIVGVLCLLFCFLYTTCLAQMGLGDLLVIAFFGIVPCVFTTYVVVPTAFQYYTLMPWNLGVATGLVIDCLLIVNNYRDIENDRTSGKRTLVVLIGKKYTEYLYLTLVPVAIIMIMVQFGYSNVNLLLGFAIYFVHIGTGNKMRRIGEGKALNQVLGETARNILIYGVLTSLLIILQ